MPSLEESKPEVRKKKKGQRKQGYIIIRQEREPWGEKNLKVRMLTVESVLRCCN